MDFSNILQIVWFKKESRAHTHRLYADAAASTPLSPVARAELVRLLEFYGNPGALYKEAVTARDELERARARVAGAIGAHTDEIVFTAGGTEANNLALQGALRPLLLERGEAHAITSAIEHSSVLGPLRALEREGLYATVLPVRADGLIDPASVAEAVNAQTALVSIQLVNSEVGTINDVAAIAKTLCKAPQGDALGASPLVLHCDAAQAPLWLDIKVEKLGADMMTLDAQKVLGPKGVGCLYVKRGTPVEPLLWGGGQERGLRGGTENVPLIGAFAAALEEAQRGAEERAYRVAAVRDYLWAEVQKIAPDAVLFGPAMTQDDTSLSNSKMSPCRRAANNLNFAIPGLDGQMAAIALDAHGIAAGTRSACDTGEEEPSHVITALGAQRSLARGAIRITLLPDATKKDARAIAAALAQAVALYRG